MEYRVRLSGWPADAGAQRGLCRRQRTRVEGDHGRAIRYVDLMRRTDGRWMVFAESNSLQYYWALLMPALRGR